MSTAAVSGSAMNAASSSSASIVRPVRIRSLPPGSSIGHMLRRQVSTQGELPPATNANAASTPTGAPAPVKAMASSASGDTTAQGSSTAIWPARSIRRPSSGVTAAAPPASAAATRPAVGAGLALDEHDDRERPHADRQRRDQHRRHERFDVRGAHDTSILLRAAGRRAHRGVQPPVAPL